MTTLILFAPYAALLFGAAMLVRALHLASKNQPHSAESNRRKSALLLVSTLVMPTLAQAAVADLRTATESGNAISLGVHPRFFAGRTGPCE